MSRLEQIERARAAFTDLLPSTDREQEEVIRAIQDRVKEDEDSEWTADFIRMKASVRAGLNVLSEYTRDIEFVWREKRQEGGRVWKWQRNVLSVQVSSHQDLIRFIREKGTEVSTSVTREDLQFEVESIDIDLINMRSRRKGLADAIKALEEADGKR